MDTAQILIVDDHMVFAEALAARLNHEPDLAVTNLADSAETALSTIDALTPDLVLMDIDLGDADGIEVAREIHNRWPRIQILVVTCLTDPARAVDAVRAGASGWMQKESAAEDLIAAARAVLRGEGSFPPEILRDVLAGLQNRHTDELARERLLQALTQREREVLQWMVEGVDRAGISELMFLSPNTVRTHTRNIFAKLDVHSSLEAVGLALRAGMRPERSVGRRPAP